MITPTNTNIWAGVRTTGLGPRCRYLSPLPTRRARAPLPGACVVALLSRRWRCCGTMRERQLHHARLVRQGRRSAQPGVWSAGRLPWPLRDEASRRGLGRCCPRGWRRPGAPRQPWLNTARCLPSVADAISGAARWVNSLVLWFNTQCSLTLKQPG